MIAKSDAKVKPQFYFVRIVNLKSPIPLKHKVVLSYCLRAERFNRKHPKTQRPCTIYRLRQCGYRPATIERILVNLRERGLLDSSNRPLDNEVYVMLDNGKTWIDQVATCKMYVAKDKALTTADMFLWSFVVSKKNDTKLMGCKYLSKVLGMTPRSVRRIVKKLKTNGMLNVWSFDRGYRLQAILEGTKDKLKYKVVRKREACPVPEKAIPKKYPESLADELEVLRIKAGISLLEFGIMEREAEADNANNLRFGKSDVRHGGYLLRSMLRDRAAESARFDVGLISGGWTDRQAVMEATSAMN